MSSKLMAVGLALAATTTVLVARGEDQRNPILDYRGGLGNPYLAVPKLHFRFGPTPVPAAAQRGEEHQLGIVNPRDRTVVLNNAGGVSVQLAIAPERSNADKVDPEGLPPDRLTRRPDILLAESLLEHGRPHRTTR